ncbi:MAG: hypothetical protein PHT94_00810 [Candidatus Nanoarchaeia archaeon]|nr:hypothetical protein [Candidatus Nanoarchaeia archaeon]
MKYSNIDSIFGIGWELHEKNYHTVMMIIKEYMNKNNLNFNKTKSMQDLFKQIDCGLYISGKNNEFLICNVDTDCDIYEFYNSLNLSWGSFNSHNLYLKLIEALGTPEIIDASWL